MMGVVCVCVPPWISGIKLAAVISIPAPKHVKWPGSTLRGAEAVDGWAREGWIGQAVSLVLGISWEAA